MEETNEHTTLSERVKVIDIKVENIKELFEYIMNGKKMQAIKKLREISGLPLRDSKEHFDRMFEKYNNVFGGNKKDPDVANCLRNILRLINNINPELLKEFARYG